MNTCKVSFVLSVATNIEITGDDEQLESDEEPAVEDLHTAKPLRKGAEYFRSGHVQNMKDCVKHGFYYLKGVVLASYDTNTDYNTLIQLSVESGFVKDASCTCAARAMGRCAHVTGLLFALKDYIDKYGTESASCTSRPCNWNKGRKRKRDPQSVSNANYTSVKKRKVNDIIDFNPTPMLKPRGKDEAAAAFLSAIECGDTQPTMWQTLIFREYNDYDISKDRASVLAEKREMLLQNIAGQGSASEVTSQQHTDEWLNERRVRVTASESKRIASAQSTHTVYNVLKTKLWFNTVQTQSMRYGNENEINAFTEYKSEMESYVPGFQCVSTGLWINSECVGIGASPDGLVYDPREESRDGLLEIKCPCVLKNQSVSEFDKILTKSQLRNFCLEKKDSGIYLKASHAYYFQIQTQLGVTEREWCDLVVWGSQGNAVTTQVKFNKEFWNELKAKLTNFHKNWLVPELFEMKIPRRLLPVKLD